jgi:hypothetical protein
MSFPEIIEVVIPAPIQIIEIQIPSPIEFVEVQVRGIQGPSGDAANSVNWQQTTPSLIWTIAHNLGFYPSVEIYSDGGLRLYGQVHNLSLNLLNITFNTAVSGTARLN